MLFDGNMHRWANEEFGALWPYVLLNMTSLLLQCLTYYFQGWKVRTDEEKWRAFILQCRDEVDYI